MNQNNVRGGVSLDKDILPKSSKNKRKRAVTVFFVLLFVVLLCGAGYGFTSVILEGVKKQKLVAGILDLDLYEGQEVIMENLYPIANEVGLIQEKSFDFRLTNTSSEDVNYLVKLVKVNTSNELALTDVVYGLTKGVEMSTGILSELNDGIIATDTIKGNQKISYELRFWLREDITDPDTTYNKTLKYKIKVEVNQKLTFNDLLKQKEDTTTNIDFSKISSATNGRGIYKYTEDGEDVYYWRGKVIDNHIVFAGFCWEGVRTTKTGGLKMIYDGVVGSDGSCKNTGTASQLSTTSAFNQRYNSPAYVGYMYSNEIYTVSVIESSDERFNLPGIKYANDVEWDGSVYKLIDVIEADGVWSTDYPNIGNKHHYTCFSQKESCDTIYYINAVNSSVNYAYYTKLNNGKKVDMIWKDMQKNETNSYIKTNIDNWYQTNIFNKNYSPYIEDTVFCNDRNVDMDYWAGWSKDGNGTNNYLRFSIYKRFNTSGVTLSCSKNDAFSVKETSSSNGKLIYPVGLLTADEIIMAGGQKIGNTDFYLYTSENYWAMTPYYSGYQDTAVVQILGDGWVGVRYSVNEELGIRPVISLSPSVLPNLTGAGTETNPYVINVN